MNRVVATIVIGLLLVPTVAQARVKWFKHTSKKYKIQLCLNTGMKLKAKKYKKWGMLAAKEGGVRVLVMAYTGPARFAELQKVAIAVTKIPGNYWKTVRRSAGWHGFGRNATYLAEGADKVAIAFLAKHGRYVDRNYVVLVGTSRANFVKRKKVFNAWGNCLKALP